MSVDVTRTEFDAAVARIATLEGGGGGGGIDANDLNAFYLLWAGALIFLMQAGFATLSAGSIRQKNVKNILLKNLLDACMGALTWFLFGYGFAYDVDDGRDGHSANGFIGGGPTNFALSKVADKDGSNQGMAWVGWQFQFAFAAAAATIVSGAVAERCQLSAYLIYTVCITGFIYPVVVHWVWDSHGFLSTLNKDSVLGGCTDFAGSGVVHMTGGWAAMVGAKILGPRIGRWETPEAFEGHSTPLQVIGTFLLWFGWYGFNPGSTLMITGAGNTAARATVTTTLAAAAGGVVGLFIKRFLPPKYGGSGQYDIAHTCNSLLGGLVGITAGCASVDPWASLLIGAIAAFAYQGGRVLLLRLKIDDVVNAAPVHLFAGMWGLLAPAFFASPQNMANAYGVAKSTMLRGIFYGGNAKMLGMQLLALVMVCVWTFAWMFPFFIMMSKLGLFRVPADMEEEGLDVSKHGGVAYPGIDGSFTGIQVGDGGKPSSVAPTIGLVPQAKPADDGTADA